MRIASVGTALPPHHYDQETLIRAFEDLWAKEHHNVARVRRFHQAVQVGGRYLALEMDEYERLTDFGAANDAFLRVGLELAQQAIEKALAAAGLTVDDVDAIWSTSVTGIGTPSLDALLFHRMGFRPDIKRTPMFGLGCAAGAAGLARLHDYLVGHPDDVVVLLSVELCSLTLQREDLSVANLIGSGLFGDGAAAVVAMGENRAKGRDLAGPAVLDSARHLYPDSERVMGWDIGANGFRLVLDKGVPDHVRRYFRGDTDGLLAKHDLTRADVGSWVLHTGGPAILKAFEEVLELAPDDLALTWRSLQEVGNLSSASVLFVLADTIAEARPDPGTWGLMAAMGPGFAGELVLLRW